jgi:hypothetical protein
LPSQLRATPEFGHEGAQREARRPEKNKKRQKKKKRKGSKRWHGTLAKRGQRRQQTSLATRELKRRPEDRRKKKKTEKNKTNGSIRWHGTLAKRGQRGTQVVTVAVAAEGNIRGKKTEEKKKKQKKTKGKGGEDGMAESFQALGSQLAIEVLDYSSPYRRGLQLSSGKVPWFPRVELWGPRPLSYYLEF